MGSNTLTTVTDHEVTNGDMWHQEKLALIGDIMPRNSSGVVENEAANLGSPTEKWAVLSCQNLIVEDIGQLNYELSSSSGAFTTTSKNLVDITNLEVTITSTGRPVVIALIPDGSAVSYVAITGSPANSVAAFAISRDGDIVYNNYLRDQTSFNALVYSLDLYLPPGAVKVIDSVEAGTHTYKARARVLYDSNTARVNYCKLLAYEL